MPPLLCTRNGAIYRRSARFRERSHSGSVGMDRAPRMHGRENAPAGSSNTLDSATGARMPPREIHRVVRECALVARLILEDFSR